MKINYNFKSNYLTKTNALKVIATVWLIVLGLQANSQVSTTTPASRCGRGPVVLHATKTEGILKWYTVPFYGTPITVSQGVSEDGTTFTTPSLEVSTTYYVDAVDDNGCSKNVENKRVPVIATISANSIQASIIYESATFCKSVTSGQLPILTGNAGGTYTSVRTSSGTGTLSLDATTGAILPSESAEGEYQVTYTVTAADGCVENPATTNIVITTAPITPTISYSGSPFCTSANTVYVNQNGASGGRYSATPSGLIIDSSNGAITPASSLSGTYTVTYFVAGAGGCAPQTATTTVTMLQLPTASISYSTSAHSYFTKNQGVQSVNLTGTGAYTGGVYSSTSGLIIDATTGAITPSTSNAGDYTVSYTLEAVSPCAAPTVATTTVTIYPLPTATIGSNQTVCQNSSAANITFTGSGGTAPYTFTYHIGSGSDQTINTTSGNSVIVSQPTLVASDYTYTLTNVTDAKGSSLAVTGKTITITVTALPVASFAYSASPYCSDGTDPLPTMLEGGEEGVFSSTNGLVFVSTTTGEIDLSASTPGSYTVTNTIAAANGCNQVTATANITITKLPVATFEYSGTPYCNSASNPSPSYIGGGEAGLFSASPAGIVFVSVTTGQIDLTNSLPGTYTITNTIAAADGCSIVTSTAPITITATPVQPEITYAGLSFCKTSDPITVTQTGTSGGVYTASGEPGELSINASSGLITPSASTPGIYTITYTIAAAGGCGVFSDTYELTITDAPTATIAYSASAYCKDNTTPQSVTITGTTGGTFSSAPEGLSMDASGTITPNTSTAGDYTVTYTIAAAGGCAEVTATASITITTPPTATISYATPFCMDIITPQEVTLTGTQGGTFSAPPGLTIHGGSGVITPSTSTAGSYTVKYTIAAAGGCDALVAETTVVINDLPAAPTASDVTVTYDGAPHTGSATAPVGSTVAWYAEATGATTAEAPTGTNVGTYSAWAESVVTATGCKSATRTQVTVTIEKATTTTVVTIAGGPFTYTGSAITPASVSVTGAGGLSLTPDATYSNNTNAGTATASYTYTENENYLGSSDSETFTIGKATATVTLGNLTQTYTGSGITATATTNPSGLTVDFTYDGSTTLPINAGTYTVVGTINDANYQGNASGSMVIAKAPTTTTVTINGGPFTYTGSAITPASVSVTGAGGLSLTPDATYSNNTNAGTATASYTYTENENYLGSSDSETFTIGKATATVTLGNLTQTYTGSGITATATTNPSELTVDFTYDGSTTLPINAGTYTVVGTINDANYQGNASGSMVITKATITELDITGITAPVTGETPVTTASNNTQYTASVSWSGSPVTFASGTVYTATITITPTSNYTLTGVAANFFTVAGATATNSVNTGVVTAVFPGTVPEAPGGAAIQPFCEGSTIANLKAAQTGTAIKVYDAATNGNELTTGTDLLTTGHYYVTQTVNSIESAPRKEITVTIYPQPQGSLSSNGPVCVDGGEGYLIWTATAGTEPFTIIYNDGNADRTANNVVSGTPFKVYSLIYPEAGSKTYTLVSVQDANCTRTSGFTGGTATIFADKPTLTGASQAATVCAGNPAIINLAGLLTGRTFTVAYSINGVAQTPVTGVTSDDYSNASFTTAMLNYGNNGQTLRITGLTVTNPASGCSATFEQDVILSVTTTLTDAPVVASPICVGATSVSGTCVSGASVTVYVNGSNPVTATVAGTTWTANVSALSAGNTITAYATASDKCISEVSNSVIVATTAAPVVSSPILVGATSVSGTSTEANGTSIEVFVGAASVGTTTVASGAWTKSGLTALTLGQVVTADATATDKCVSAVSNSVTVVAATKYIVTSSNYSPQAGTSVTISAQLVNDSNAPIPVAGITVSWSKANGTGSFDSATSTTDSNGIATVIFITPATKGSPNVITATDGNSRTGSSSQITTQ